jgi:hypothetical protein
MPRSSSLVDWSPVKSRGHKNVEVGLCTILEVDYFVMREQGFLTFVLGPANHSAIRLAPDSGVQVRGSKLGQPALLDLDC